MKRFIYPIFLVLLSTLVSAQSVSFIYREYRNFPVEEDGDGRALALTYELSNVLYDTLFSNGIIATELQPEIHEVVSEKNTTHKYYDFPFDALEETTTFAITVNLEYFSEQIFDEERQESISYLKRMHWVLQDSYTKDIFFEKTITFLPQTAFPFADTLRAAQVAAEELLVSLKATEKGGEQ